MSTTADLSSLDEPQLWCSLTDRERRETLSSTLLTALEGEPGVTGVGIAVGSVERPYDYTAIVETDAGKLRTPLWSHARAMMFCDESVHPANREKFAPAHAVAEAADRLRRRLAVPYTLESRRLTVTASALWSCDEAVPGLAVCYELTGDFYGCPSGTAGVIPRAYGHRRWTAKERLELERTYEPVFC